VGTVAMVQLLAAGTMANSDSTDQMIGITPCNNIREMTQTSSKFFFSSEASPSHWGLETGETKWTADDLDDFDGQSFSPPVDGRRVAIDYLSGWSQAITVQTVDPSNVRLVVPHGTQTPDLRPISK